MNRPKTPDPLLARQMEALRAQFLANALGLPLPYFYATSDFLAEVSCWCLSCPMSASRKRWPR
ncbi:MULTISPECIES: hypothetical protein [Lysobacteraceae]|uniref:hypothetical protein n=1 Tax=Lysobacteraceae TaxID=32033 RepID=UPI00027A418E|nr:MULTISPECIES: hypothetical protein [Stenotrophomonas]ARQ88873.1 hypothetical protein A7326_04445 [Stenotrophomonas maltophilia]EJP77449.1 hypothetical protein A1OC_00887 [Stenotrophomonas maltophilia Ab55555]MCO7473293.1 hypothetical protein [Stenotrophomonas maltophilia]MCO7496711.1 hypothetical protein [Stenotrophomonas maltophilia]MDH2035396.1 hypothetical protein [Stenotrophomonas maltophilia]